MCRVAAAVANGGYLVQPHVIKQIEGEAPPAYSKVKIGRMNPNILEFLKRGMTGVVHDAHGTARASRIADLRAAGKTGTSQNPHGEDHAWFIGYAPADNPQISLAIVVENAGHGGAIAAPIARDFYLRFFGKIPADSQITRMTGPDGLNVLSD
jgi:peptidoglycan glycosyltransferase